MPVAALSQLSYEAGVRALDLQERAIEQLRGRTGLLLAASSLTASFLGGQTISHANGLGKLSGIALIALGASIALSVYVLLPKSGFVFSLSGVGMFEELFDVEEEQEMRRRLVYWLEEYWVTNQAKIDELSRFFFAAAVALMLQLAFWSWALADTIS
jgi:hypothetical protein